MTKEFENNEQENIWSILNIEETTDIKKIRHGYAVMSKSCHPEKEPKKFQQLYHAYQEAIKWAKAYKKREKNVSIDDTKLFAEKSEMEYHTEEQEKKTEESESSFSMFNNLEQNQIEKEETETTENETVLDTTYENLFRNITPVAKKGLASFQNYFELPEQKDWKEYVTTPEFLRAQYDESFAKQLAGYLKTQIIYPVEQLPYDMVKELYFSYYPFLCEQTPEFFENGFHELFKVIFQNQEIERIEELHEDPSVKSEVVKYQVYYRYSTSRWFL